jgi:GT2 family glycosyltransferase
MRVTDYDPFELIVVDANSTDGTLEYLVSKPEVRLVPLGENYPYSYSLNRGIQAAKGEYLCFMNNDMIISRSDWLRTLVACVDNDPEIGIVGPRLLNTNDERHVRRSRLSSLIMKTPIVKWGEGTQLPRYIYPDGKEYKILVEDNTITPCTYVMGACFLAKRELIDAVGLFDEEFFFAYDETDYCVRSWKAGRKVVCNTKTAVVHLVGKTMKAVADEDCDCDVHRYENPYSRFYRKHSPKDFEMILRQAKGPVRFYLWKIQYPMRKVLNLVGKGVEAFREEGLRTFLGKMKHYVLQRRKRNQVRPRARF